MVFGLAASTDRAQDAYSLAQRTVGKESFKGTLHVLRQLEGGARAERDVSIFGLRQPQVR